MRLLGLQPADKLGAMAPQPLALGEAERLAIERHRPFGDESKLGSGGRGGEEPPPPPRNGKPPRPKIEHAKIVPAVLCCVPPRPAQRRVCPRPLHSPPPP